MPAEVVPFTPKPNPQREAAILSALAEIIKQGLAERGIALVKRKATT
jgi:hypothetical protein